MNHIFKLFYCWLVKDISYFEKPDPIQKLMVRITANFEEIDVEICERVYDSPAALLQLYIDHESSYFGHYREKNVVQFLNNFLPNNWLNKHLFHWFPHCNTNDYQLTDVKTEIMRYICLTLYILYVCVFLRPLYRGNTNKCPLTKSQSSPRNADTECIVWLGSSPLLRAQSWEANNWFEQVLFPIGQEKLKVDENRLPPS